MKKYLLDTNIFLWWLDADKRLTTDLIEIINNPRNIKFLSVVSIWEIIIKVQANKFQLFMPIEKLLEKFEFEFLDVKLNHVLGVAKLSKIHKDPFDRILISQAKSEDCILLSSDKLLKKYFLH